MKKTSSEQRQYSLPSLTIFFPFYNDAGTVLSAIEQAFLHGKSVTKKLQVIAIHGGKSNDLTWKNILHAKQLHPSLQVIDASSNAEGYAVIKKGFAAAKHEWIFYTDGDLQFNISELIKLVKAQNRKKIDVVNGYRLHRNDPGIRVFIGTVYRFLCRTMFSLPISDIDCDFRLMRSEYVKQISFSSQKSSILPELIKKLEFLGASFFEIPVSHVHRQYGSSNYSTLNLLHEKTIGDIRLWWNLRKILVPIPTTKFKEFIPYFNSTKSE